MKTLEINGMTFFDFGSNNYSCGMTLITADMKPNLIYEVLHGHYPGVYLNPSAPCTHNTFYGVFGTAEQYSEFYRVQKESQIAKMTWERLHKNYSNLEFTEAKKRAEINYFDWWNRNARV